MEDEAVTGCNRHIFGQAVVVQVHGWFPRQGDAFRKIKFRITEVGIIYVFVIISINQVGTPIPVHVGDADKC